MAQYPQGVTTFIPDYQAYQPDFNFTANVLQLKQTQYDQNWNRLNNIYGQYIKYSFIKGMNNVCNVHLIKYKYVVYKVDV